MIDYFAERDVEAARASLRLYCELALRLAGVPADPAHSESAAST